MGAKVTEQRDIYLLGVVICLSGGVETPALPGTAHSH